MVLAAAVVTSGGGGGGICCWPKSMEARLADSTARHWIVAEVGESEALGEW